MRKHDQTRHRTAQYVTLSLIQSVTFDFGTETTQTLVTLVSLWWNIFIKKILGSGFPKLWLCNNWVIGQKKAEALVTTSSQFLRACSTTKVIWTYLCHLCVVGLLFNTCGDWDESCKSYCRLAFYMSHKHIITLSFCFDGVAVDCRIDAVWKQQLMNITPWFSDLSDKSE